MDGIITDRPLYELWPSLNILGDSHKLEAHKLLNRAESIRQENSFVYFDIDRHGATVNGSIYCEVHTWKVNLETKEAEVIEIAKRRLDKAAPRLDVKPLATEIADLIAQHRSDHRLKWLSETKVRLAMQKIIPATNAQTTSGRRRRFYAQLESLLPGWQRRTCFLENSQNGK
jgi:hypothetical protein